MSDTGTHNYDALLLLSFGGPEGEEEVVPFLENVTRGRGIPRERLKQVGEHYFHFGGVSPLNRLNREIIDNLQTELADRGHQLPVYFGNRNWHPMAEDTAAQMSRNGVRNALVFATSAWAGYSACLQYSEDIRRMREYLGEAELAEINFTKLRQFYDHPLFIETMARHVRAAFDTLPEDRRADARLIFTAHSVPDAADDAAGGPGNGNLYSRQVMEASRLVAEAADVDTWDQAWNSRSGNPATPWLEPDVVDHLQQIHRDEGVTAMVVCPIGFISDHMEVIWDLDSELADAAKELGVDFARVDTAGATPEFSRMVVDIIEELLRDAPPARLGTHTLSGCTVNGAPCAPGCCQVQRPKSATA
ncbi:Ferrochelatase [Corynebacterium occultum]|uniref:Coproporphyrin III ferrochelatase n=1 Tax=Corynebacterium occultum TaxID=2675219 RepID=A0A6B8W4I6_9CORY|nr:ferrochelatase [Corynebacterium occultum]QGU07441.1 Ferrochelatase [Corynebacterium occultum]